MKNHSGHTSLLTKIEPFYALIALSLDLGCQKMEKIYFVLLKLLKVCFKTLNCTKNGLTDSLYDYTFPVLFMIYYEMLRLKNEID